MKEQCILLLISIACIYSVGRSQPCNSNPDIRTQCDSFYKANADNGLSSRSTGTTGKGKLINGKLLPYSGSNFACFDVRSYLAGRAFVHGKVKATLIESYRLLDSLMPQRFFYIMECSNRNGGKLFPHNTHQNGLSVDLMMLKLKQGKPYLDLDTLGIPHYWIDFNNEGQYTEDTSITIDFEVLARQILLLEQAAKKNGLHIVKVIIKIELKDELFKGTYGRLLKKSGIYFAQVLTPDINSSHDEHIHVDFELKK